MITDQLIALNKKLESEVADETTTNFLFNDSVELNSTFQGNKIYRKQFFISSLPNNGGIGSTLLGLDIEYLFKLDIVFYKDGVYYDTNTIHNIEDVDIRISVNGEYFSIEVDQNLSDYSAIVTLEYTLN